MITDPVDILLTLLETRSVAGNTGQAMDLVGKHLSGLGLEVTRTNKGSLIPAGERNHSWLPPI